MKISVADGSKSKAVGVGNFNLSNMTLKSVLHVLNIRYNLIQVSKLNKRSNCAVIFYPSYCEL